MAKEVQSLLKRILRSKEGISPILATLLLIVIAVAAVIVTYAWVMTFTSSTTSQAGARIKFDTVRIDAATNNVTMYVRNWGDEKVLVDKVYIESQDFTGYTDLGSGKEIIKGGLLTITLTNLNHPMDFSAGTNYKVKVSGPATYWEEPIKAT